MKTSRSTRLQDHRDCVECPIRDRAVCSRCDGVELETLNNLKSYETFAPGQTIVWAGEETTFLGSVVSGVATLSQTMEDGRRQMLGLLLPSDFVGRPGRSVARMDVTAVSEVLLCKFRRSDFEAMIEDTPSISQRLLEIMMDELDDAHQWMLILGRKTAREKIASFLAIIARRQLPHDRLFAAPRLVFELPITREAMADYLGLTLETVSRQISALKKEGVIEIEGLRQVVVPSFDRLLNETGDSGDVNLVV
ncbi:MAG: Crp/Fnr family transcriptional regulator [Pseudomonadota bacterium]